MIVLLSVSRGYSTVDHTGAPRMIDVRFDYEPQEVGSRLPQFFTLFQILEIFLVPQNDSHNE